MENPITSSPTAKPVTPAPSRATTPARSLPCPDGNVAGHRLAYTPVRIATSPGLIDAARTCTSTCPGPGSGRATSATYKTSMSPYPSNLTAFGMAYPLLLNQACRGAWRSAMGHAVGVVADRGEQFQALGTDHSARVAVPAWPN